MAKDSVSARQLWQVPVFLLGATALTAYLLVRPSLIDPLVRAEARLDRARKMWQKHDPHARKLIGHVLEYLTWAGPDAEHAGEAHLIWASSLARAARTLSAEDAKLLWKQSWEHLGTAKEKGLDGDHLNVLRALRGEVGHHVGLSPTSIQRCLSKYHAYADDPAEAYRLLALACLKRNPPQLTAALQANEKLRLLPLVSEDILGPARLQGGEILMQLRRPTDARKLLEKIGKDAPPELLSKARELRALSLQEESQWEEAATLWQETLDDTRRPLENPGRVYYHLGYCRRRLEQRDAAIPAWREAVVHGNLQTAAAAALGLVELLLPDGDADLLDLCARAVRGIHRVEDWKNPHVDLKQARGLFEQTSLVLRQKREFARALDLVDSYEKLALPGQAAYLRGLTLREWGKSLQAGESADRARSADLMRQAGAAFRVAAEGVTEKGEKAERLWLSAEGHFEGGEAARTVSVLEQFLALDGHAAERSGEAWYRLAQAQAQRRDATASEAAYRRCMSYRSRFAHRARYQLAQVELARGKKELAGDMLELNLKGLRLDHDDEAMEKSLYALGRLRHEQGDHATVRPLLEEALAKYPSSGSEVRGRFDLAETYRQLAAQENQNVVQGGNLTAEARDHFLKQRRHWLVKAAEQYQILNQRLNDPAVIAVLTTTELVHVAFSVADCRFNLGEYTTALKLYDGLAERYRNRLERLSALGGTARCYAAQRDFSRFRTRLEDIRVALQDVDEQTRRQWEEWLQVAGKGQ